MCLYWLFLISQVAPKSKRTAVFLTHYLPAIFNVILMRNPTERCLCKHWAQSPKMQCGEMTVVSYCRHSAWLVSDLRVVIVVLAWNLKLWKHICLSRLYRLGTASFEAEQIKRLKCRCIADLRWRWLKQLVTLYWKFQIKLLLISNIYH